MWAVPVAVAAAGCFAVSTALQHRGASGQAAGRWWVRLPRRPGWVAGLLAGAGGFTLHAVAVRLGALAVVQPVLVSGVVFALPVRAALDRRAPSRLSLLWAAVTASGLALFLVAVAPTAGPPRPDAGAGALLVGLGAAVAGIAAAAGAGTRSGRWRGLLWGFAAGILFGLTAGTLKMTTAVAVAGGAGSVAGSWPVYALVVLGGCGLAVNQCAYRAAPLAVSMPVLNIVSPLAAIGFGAAVFGQRPADHPVAVVLQLAGLVVMAVGVTALTRHVSATPAAAVESEPESESASRVRVAR